MATKGLQPLYVKDAPTEIEGGAFSLPVAAGANLSDKLFAGGKSGRIRKCIIITNRNTASGENLQILHPKNRNVIASVYPSSSFQIFTSDDIIVNNASAAAVSVAVCEVFYAV